MQRFSRFSTGMLLISALVAGLAESGSAQQSGDDTPQVAVFTVKGMCCAKESGPAVKELSKVPGVAKVVVSHKAGTLTIFAKENMDPSPIAIWEAVQKVNAIKPVRLATAHGTFTTKPRFK